MSVGGGDDHGSRQPVLALLRSILRLPEPTDTYVMNVAFVVVFGGGVTVLTLLLLPPRPQNLALPANVAVAVVAAVAAALVGVLRHRALPAPVIHALTAFGTVLITVVVAFGGDATTQFSVFYLWMVVYAAAFFTLGGWSAHVVLAAIGYALAAWSHPQPDQLIDFAPVVTGPALVVGGFVHVVAARMRATARRLLECVQISGRLITDTPERHATLPAICHGTRRACEAVAVTLAVPGRDGEWVVVAHDGAEPVTAEEVAALAPSAVSLHAPDPTGAAGPWLVDPEHAERRGSRLVHPLQDNGLIGVLVVDWATSVARLSDLAAHLLRAYAQQATTALSYDRVHRSLTRLATTDALTGLPNRRALESAMAAHGTGGRRAGDTIALALFDLDGFKAFNDTHGHAAGDQLLRDIASIWHGRLRQHDLLARLGGDEFALLARHTAPSGAVALARQLCELIPSAEVTCSAGVAVSAGEESLAELMETADHYLYAAKQEGGGLVLAPADDSPEADPVRVIARDERSGARRHA